MKIKVKCIGIVDYLQNQYTISEEESKGVKRAKSLATDATSKVDEVVYKDEDGCYIPDEHFLAAIKFGASKLVKKGATKWTGDFIAGVLIEENKIRFIPNKKIWDDIHISHGRRPPRTGGRVAIHRPLFKKGWKAEFTIIVDDDIPKQIVESVMEITGHKIGIGDWRPRFGRFDVELKEVR
ncbi:hypothetical protein A2Z67_04670 [Candidatus Woesebacteria bacterium RBG_13_36_22]|uniref:Uncharacterized protein n=1 Tax=Candidatus Woesebacteria bacterium RBG_13_36_22 TaxID=1802478 RepID=A0A1F7X2A7_9BACT|nr:MAG: hypothetical protein A2Z67_04670 [Candidatus Woesebacteria bacterium RBG_13_36_22]